MTDEPKATPSESEAEEKRAEAETEASTAETGAAKSETAAAKAAGDEPAAAADPVPEAEAEADPAEAKAEDGERDPDPAPADDRAAKLIEALQAENADLKDRLLRAAAEMENMRRRYEREMADARQYAVTGFAREVLSIGDNLSRAIAAVPEEASKEGGAIKALIDGVEMTERELHRVLNKHGVTKLEPEGKKFDPNMHQAMFEVEHADMPHGTVVQVVQAGYSIGDRVLRPAMVGVARKVDKPKPAESAEKESAEATATEGKAEEAASAGPKAANDS